MTHRMCQCHWQWGAGSAGRTMAQHSIRMLLGWDWMHQLRPHVGLRSSSYNRIIEGVRLRPVHRESLAPMNVRIGEYS